MSDYRGDWNSECSVALLIIRMSSNGNSAVRRAVPPVWLFRQGWYSSPHPPTVLSQMESNTHVKCLARLCLTFQAQINKHWPLRLFSSTMRETAMRWTGCVCLTRTRPIEWTSLAGFLALQNFRTGFIRYMPGISWEQCTKGSVFTFPAPCYYNVTPPHMDACFWIHVS